MVTETLKAPYSYYLLDGALSQEIDQKTIREAGISGFTLMEVAGSGAAKLLLQEHSPLSHGIFLCGKGNNAGDALVVARYLLQNEVKATLVFLSGTDDLSADAGKNLQLLKTFDKREKLTFCESWENFSPPSDFDFIVDGILGTGLSSNLRGDYRKAVEWANQQESPVFSLDIPTGLHADTGRNLGRAIAADRTITFGGRKQGFYLNEGPSVCGDVEYCELPFPNHYKDKCSTFLLDEDWVPSSTPVLRKHKYETGVLYIIAGSEGLTGAVIMGAQSAWAEGLGAVILICPRGILPIFEQTLPFAIKKPVGSRNDYFFKKDHASDALKIVSEKKGKVLFGPGLGRESSTVTFTEQFLPQNTADIVIDADGLWCLSQLTDFKKPEESDWILTPHPGELHHLTGVDFSGAEERLEIVRRFAQEHRLSLVSKGMPGIIGTPGGKCYLTHYPTRYFARAGSGDVLAGKIGAYLALGYHPSVSCANGLLHGKRKLQHFLMHYKGIPEPKDFI